MTAYYNENDPFAAAWLKELIEKGLIYPGYVDQRSIEEIQASDLEGYDQCHFFAGIGGWSYALRLAGWPDDRPVWTGSCPCQPLSSAGQRKGHADKRHLWPAFQCLIAKCKPSIVFGEQVASKDGREWLAGVRADLEAMGYACGAADLCAAGVGAPHIRQRLYWVADSQRAERWPIDRARRNERQNGIPQRKESSDRIVDIERLGDASGEGFQEQRRIYQPSGERCSGLTGFAVQAGVPEWNGPTVAVECSDGWRRISAQPDAFPLADGVSGRMGKLRGAGNAINPQVAQAFIEAWLEI